MVMVRISTWELGSSVSLAVIGALNGLRAASGVDSDVPGFFFPFLWLSGCFVVMKNMKQGTQSVIEVASR